MKKIFWSIAFPAVCLALSLSSLSATLAMAAEAKCVKLEDVKSLFDLATIDKKPIKKEFHGKTYTTNVAVNHIQGFTCYYHGSSLPQSSLGFITHSSSSDYGDYLVLYEDDHQKFQAVTPEKGFNHPGGLQLIGDYAVVPIEKDDSSYVYAFDLSGVTDETTKKTPAYFPLSFPGETDNPKRAGKAGVVGICDYTDAGGKNYFLLAVYDNGVLSFYTSEITAGSTLENAKFSKKNTEFYTTQKGAFHGMSLIVQEGETDGSGKRVGSDRVFLVGFCVEDYWGSYRDYVGLYEVDLVNFILDNKVSDRHMTTTGGGMAGVHFRWGSSALARPGERLELYATERQCSGSHMTYNIFSSASDLDSMTPPGGSKTSGGGCSTFGFGFGMLALAATAALRTVSRRR